MASSFARAPQAQTRAIPATHVWRCRGALLGLGLLAGLTSAACTLPPANAHPASTRAKTARAHAAQAGRNGVPAASTLRTGDLIAHTSTSRQARAIAAATASPYTHVGMIRVHDGHAYVIEAVGPVRVVPLASFIKRGKNRAYTIWRDPRLTDAQRETLWRTAKRYRGRPYDSAFSFDNDAIYCSELVHLAYQSVGLRLGRVERIGELHHGPKVKALLAARWKRHPACKGMKSKADCAPKLAKATLITPAAQVGDGALHIVHQRGF